MEAVADARDTDIVTVDDTSVGVHHSAATFKKDPRRCTGRSKGGLTTKIHALVNETGLPIRFEHISGQDHAVPVCKVLLTHICPDKPALADKAYDTDWIGDMIWEQEARDVIPSKASRKRP